MDLPLLDVDNPAGIAFQTLAMVAINDSFMIESAIYHLLKVHFRSQPYYADLLDLFHETTYKTEFGQLVDLITAPEDKVDLSKFSMERCVLHILS